MSKNDLFGLYPLFNGSDPDSQKKEENLYIKRVYLRIKKGKSCIKKNVKRKSKNRQKTKTMK
ncbi:hypothetical protein BH10BAC5_BH10BAC5_25370 [soil metagenome]